MEVKTNENLESTGYRCLFECVKERGIEPVMHFIKDIRSVSSKNVLLQKAILSGKNELLALVKSNQSMIRYLRQHEKDFQCFRFSHENVFDTLYSLSQDISRLELYLENAKKLEALKVCNIDFNQSLDFDRCDCDIFRNEQGKIINISKYYTDGKIQSVGQEYGVNSSFHYSKLPFSIDENSASFLVWVKNNEKFYSYREIYIKSFAFDGTKLPTEEEIQSYEIPKQLIKK